jgi:hypothetical protein
MNNIFWKHTSTLVTLASVVVVASSLPARADNSVVNQAPNQLEQVSETPETAANSASSLIIAEPTESAIAETLTTTTPTSQTVAQVIQPGRTTRSGPSYLGVAGNIGITGDTTLSESSFAVISKIGLTQNFSVRPTALIGDNTVVLVPITVDFPQRNLETAQVTIAPYIGGGVAISTGRDSTVGGLISGV